VAPTPQTTLAGPTRPTGSPEIPQVFLPSASKKGTYSPRLYGAATVHFRDRKRKIDEIRSVAFLLPLPEDYSDLQAAPLLCAGLIGYRALQLSEVEGLTGSAPRLGLYGFGASAHIVIQVAMHLGHEVHVVTRGEESRRFASELGAASVSGSDEPPPVELDSAIIFAPAGELVPRALAAVRKGGIVVCAGIHMSPVPELPYDLLWGERVLRSVANLTRADGREFLDLAPDVPVRTKVEEFPLEEAEEALTRLKAGELRGAAVLVP